MESKFKNVRVEPDTKILFQVDAKFGEYPVRYQKWYWDGIIAESLIFDENDIAAFTDQGLESEVRSSPLIKSDSKVTVSRAESGFVFVNFNFEPSSEDDATVPLYLR